MTPGQVAYAAYGMATGNKNFMGDPMPEWKDLPVIIQEAWQAAASTVLRSFHD
jgi:hypothetical protein